MSFEAFQNRVNALVSKAGGNIKVKFREDKETGRHFANFQDGTVITGNTSSLKVSVRWGKSDRGYNHAAVACI